MKTRSYDCVAVGNRIKKARERLNITQENISERMNVGPQHISDVERGAVGISIDMLMKICETLDITADYVLFGNEAGHGENMLYHIVRKLDDKDQQFIEDFVELYVQRLKDSPFVTAVSN